MAHSNIEIAIRTTADLKAAQEWAAQTQTQIGKLKQLGQSTTELEAELKQLDSAIGSHYLAQVQSNAGTEEGASLIAGLSGKHRELIEALRQGGAQLVEFGHLGLLSLDPLTASITGVALLFAYAKRQIDDFNKSLDEMAARASQADWGDAIKDQLEVFKEAKQAADDLADSIEHDTSAEREYHKAVEESIGLEHEKYAAHEKTQNLQKGLALESINFLEKNGQLTKEQAAAARAAVENSYALKELDAQKHLDADELNSRRLELAKTADDQKRLQSAFDAANARAKGSAANVKEREAELADATKNQPQIQKDFDAAKSALEYYFPSSLPQGVDFDEFAAQKKAAESRLPQAQQDWNYLKAQEDYEKAKAAFDINQNTIRTGPAAIAKAADQAEDDARARDYAKKEVSENAKRIDNLTDALRKLTDAINSKQQSANTDVALKNETTSLHAASEIVGGFGGAGDKSAVIDGHMRDTIAAANNIGQVLASGHGNLKAALQHLLDIARQHDTDIRNLSSRIEAQKGYFGPP